VLTGKSRPFCWFRVQRWRAQSLGIVVSSRPRRWCLATRHSDEMTTVGPAVVRRVQSRPSAVTILRLSCDYCATVMRLSGATVVRLLVTVIRLSSPLSTVMTVVHCDSPAIAVYYFVRQSCYCRTTVAQLLRDRSVAVLRLS